MQQIAVARDRVMTEREEALRWLAVATSNERIRDECAVAWPDITVRIAAELQAVAIVGCQNRAAVVDLRTQNEETLPVETPHLFRQYVERLLAAMNPPAPVVAGPSDDALGRQCADVLIEHVDLVGAATQREPEEGGGGFLRLDGQVK